MTVKEFLVAHKMPYFDIPFKRIKVWEVCCDGYIRVRGDFEGLRGICEKWDSVPTLCMTKRDFLEIDLKKY